MHWSMILAAKQDVRVGKNMDFEVRQIRFESWFCYYLLGNLLLGALLCNGDNNSIYLKSCWED